MRKLFAALLVACVLVSVFALSVDAQSTWQRFNNVWVNALRVSGNESVSGTLGVTGATTVGGALGVTGASTLTGATSVGAGLTVGTFIASTVANTLTVVADGTVTATGTLQPLTAAGGVGTSNVVVLPNGTIVTFLNVGSNTITFTDTGTLVLSGNAALGAGDSVTLQSNGVNMYQIAASNN